MGACPHDFGIPPPLWCSVSRTERAGDDEENESASGAPTRNGQIVFRRYFDPEQTKSALFTMNPDGSHVRQITHPPKGWHDQNPAWSPDGKRVAFYRQRVDESMSRIMVINPDTGV